MAQQAQQEEYLPQKWWGDFDGMAERREIRALVGYIHLNPLRAKRVAELKELAKYPYAGHRVLMGKQKREFQAQQA